MRDDVRTETRLLPHAAPADEAARLLLFAMRRMAAHGLSDAHAAHALLIRFRRGYRRPLVLLRALMAEVSRASSRKIVVAPCCCPRLTRDEHLLLAAARTAIAAPHAAHATLAEVLGIADCLGALASAQVVAQAFDDLGHPLRAG